MTFQMMNGRKHKNTNIKETQEKETQNCNAQNTELHRYLSNEYLEGHKNTKQKHQRNLSNDELR